MSHEGCSNREIIDALDISKNVVARIRQNYVEHGISFVLNIRGQQPIPENTIRDAKILRSEGRSLRQIAEALDVSHEVVRKHLNRSTTEGNAR